MTEQTPVTRAQEIRERVEKATPGPWRAVHSSDWAEDIIAADGTHVFCWGHDYDDHGYANASDAEFAAHAREDIPYLLNALDTQHTALRALVQQWREKELAADSSGYRDDRDRAAVYSECADALATLLGDTK